MKGLSWRDVLATVLVIFGGVVVFAKLQAYSWWLLGSWKGALGVLAGTGAAIAALYLIDWLNNETLAPLGEMGLWLLAALVTVGSLFVSTTKAEFVSSAALIGVAWVAQLGAHTWNSTHHTSRLAHVH